MQVNVANSQPRSINLPTLDSLVPKWGWIVQPYKKGFIDERVYKERYFVQLQANIGWIDQEIKEFLDKHDPKRKRTLMLVCWEPEGKFCHRNLAAEWLRANSPELFINKGYEKRLYKCFIGYEEEAMESEESCCSFCDFNQRCDDEVFDPYAEEE